MERTQVIIRHADTAALKAHPLWAMIMELFLADGPVCVEVISEVDEEASDDDYDPSRDM